MFNTEVLSYYISGIFTFILIPILKASERRRVVEQGDPCINSKSRGNREKHLTQLTWQVRSIW